MINSDNLYFESITTNGCRPMCLKGQPLSLNKFSAHKQKGQ